MKVRLGTRNILPGDGIAPMTHLIVCQTTQPVARDKTTVCCLRVS